MKIVVTAQMIKAGERCHGARCPLALAFNDAGFADVMVFSVAVDFYDPATGECVATLPLPPVARRFQKAFDDGLGEVIAALLGPDGSFDFEMPGLEPGKLPFTHFLSVAVV